MIIYLGKRKINLNARKVSVLGRVIGLMFRTKKTGNLLFEFKHDVSMSIHSFFVFFSFLAVWLDEKNRVIEWKIVKPFTVALKPKKPFRRLAEVPLNKKNSKIIKLLE